MNYISLNDYKKAWVFRHKDLPIESDDFLKIKPMSEARSANLWASFISNENDHPDFFKPSDWPGNDNNWSQSIEWEKPWQQDEAHLPEELIEHLNWDNNTVIYFCISRRDVIETSWSIFKRYWKNFLFMSDGSIVIGKKRKEAAQFLENGQVKLGIKP